MFISLRTGSRGQDPAVALAALKAKVMLADADLNITYMNPSLVDFMREAETELKAELPNFSVSTLIGSNIDAFHRNPVHQRQLLANLTGPHSTTIRIGARAFDLTVTPLRKGTRNKGFCVEWSDANARLANVDFMGQITAISRSQAVIEFTVDGTIMHANQNFLDATGYRLDEIVGRKHRMFVDDAQAQGAEYRDLWAHLAAGEYQSGEHRRVGKGGREIWIQGAYNPILDEHGKVAKVVKFANDVTQRVKAVSEVGKVLSDLAAGNLTARVQGQLPRELDQLRVDLNSALETMQDVLRHVQDASNAIEQGTREIQSSSDDLSKRTEQQAASLEETSASLDEITATVRQTSENSRHAREVVNAASENAQRSNEIVGQTVVAMSAIEQSSRQISQIIGVIDEIAFQTNLLALNAGVEAARAGEAGRGFAVVASEVRALAQRSAEAAKEIKALIVDSGERVSQGVSMVTQTGEALERIVRQVTEISTIVVRIAVAAEEESVGIGQVNTAVNQMDRMTQQNAAMVEQSTAATHALAQQAEELGGLVMKFNLGHIGRPAAQTDQRPTRQVRSAASGAATARKLETAPRVDEWEEF